MATFDECLLVGKKEAVYCTHYVVSEGCCDDAIVCIGDGDWAGLVYIYLGVLGDEVEKSMVEAVGGRGPGTESPDDPEKDGGSVLGESSVEREVEAVWAWARVSRAGDGSCNRGERWGRQVGKPARVVSKHSREVGWAGWLGLPVVTPECGGDVVHLVGVRGGGKMRMLGVVQPQDARSVRGEE